MAKIELTEEQKAAKERDRKDRANERARERRSKKRWAGTKEKIKDAKSDFLADLLKDK